MTRRVIDVCQDCGEYIEPIRIPGTDRALIFCTSDTCTLRRLGPIPALHVPEPIPAHARAFLFPIVLEPTAAIRITGAA